MKRPASLVAGILFLLMAVAQLCRFVLGIEVVAAGVVIPVWPSAVAAVVLVLLAYWLLKERSK
jgi:multidrug transporter EmrE-like cation transporter